jgi:DNA replication and repair protein RecF
MQLNHIKLVQFKNHLDLDIRPSGKWNAITGLNGQGKTNALDGIYMLCVLKSFLNHSLEACIAHDCDFFRLEMSVDELDSTRINFQKAGIRQLVFNGKKINNMTDYIGRYPIMVIQPIDDYRLLEGSSARRRILDQAISQMNGPYLQALMKYNKLLKQRNALLKRLRQRGERSPLELQIYEPQLHACALELYQGRKDLVDVMQDDLHTFYHRISGGREFPVVSFNTDVDPLDYLKTLQAAYQVDIQSGRTTRGPHLDDLQLTLDGRLLKSSGSQGQRKSFLVALKLAIYRIMANWTEKLPILLLDDLFDKLDNDRVKHLLTLINEKEFGQVFISDKDDIHLTKLFSELNFNFNHIKLADE